MTTSFGKHLENISHAHVVSLMYKLKTIAKGSDDLSIGFDRDRGRRQQELTKNRNLKGKYHIRIYSKDNFGSADYQEKATFGFGYELTLTGNTDNAVLNEDNPFNNAKIKIMAIERYIPHYIPSISNQAILFEQIASKTPTELQYVAGSVFMKKVNAQILGSFDLGTLKRINLALWIIASFQKRDRQDLQKFKFDTF